MNVFAKRFWVGLISGTSVDAIDAALVEINQERLELVHAYAEPFPADLKQAVINLTREGENEINLMGQLDVQLGELFAKTTLELLRQANIKPREIAAVGSHGQTIRHQPNVAYPFTLQVADPNIIVARTGITTVADFRRRDMALGGQGAPLVPAFHQAIFSDSKQIRVIVNIGGIANVTLLPKSQQQPILGFDTGPGNGLLDQWCQLHQGEHFDYEGRWGAQGQLNEALLSRLLDDPFFQLSAPKSTGREYFNLRWLHEHLSHFSDIAPVDVQATLVELTARTIVAAVRKEALDAYEVILCGGGVHNLFLMQRLKALFAPFSLLRSETFGVHPDWVEAVAFAWFAYRTLNGYPSNVPSVTGASHSTVLGGIYCA